ncbi:MAG: patatin-like phospholipase family protein [Candidatus Omnitrophota bacterium]
MNSLPGNLDKTAIIKKIPLFSDLSPSSHRLIEAKSYVAEYKRDHILYCQGDPADSFYCMITGRAQVFVRTKSEDEKDLTMLHRGDYVGIMSLLTDEPHSATVRIINDALILRVDKSNFAELLKAIPQLAINVSRSLSRRLKSNNLNSRTIFESTIISIFGLKKKSGRTMYAVNFAASLAKETRKKVILLDMSRSGCECASALRMENKPPRVDLNSINLDHDAIKLLMLRDKTCGIYLLNLAYDPAQPYETAPALSLLSYLASEFHYIVLDLSMEENKIARDLLTQSDSIHLVVSRGKDDLKAVETLKKELSGHMKNPEGRFKILINEFFSEEKTMEDLLLSHARNNYAVLPDMGILAGAMSAGLPPVSAVPDNPYSMVVRRLARETGKVLVGLALGSGAALGLAHIGVIKVFEREKIPVDFIAGTSIGAVVGAFWASGLSAAEIEKIALGFKKKRELLSLADFSIFPLQGFLNGNRLVKFFKSVLGNRTFLDTRIPIKIIASTLRSRQTVVIDEGILADALRASCSIPALIKPRRKDEDFLIDGGTQDPVPVDVLSRMGAKKIIAVNCFPSPEEALETFRGLDEKRRKEESELSQWSFLARTLFNIKAYIRRTFTPNIFDVLMNTSLSLQYVLAEISSRDADCVLHPVIPTTTWFELYKVEELIKKGEEEAERMLPQIKALIEE